MLLAWAAWVGLGGWLSHRHPEVAGTPVRALFTVAFGALTLWGVSVPIIGTARWLRHLVIRKPKPDGAEFIVCVVPGSSRSSPSLAQITSGLPSYCKRLMAGGASPPLL